MKAPAHDMMYISWEFPWMMSFVLIHCYILTIHSTCGFKVFLYLVLNITDDCVNFDMQGMQVFIIFCRKNGSFISCRRPCRFEQRPHGGGHQFCGEMHCNSGKYLMFSHYSKNITCFPLLWWQFFRSQVYLSYSFKNAFSDITLYTSDLWNYSMHHIQAWNKLMTWDRKVLCLRYEVR